MNQRTIFTTTRQVIIYADDILQPSVKAIEEMTTKNIVGLVLKQTRRKHMKRSRNAGARKELIIDVHFECLASLVTYKNEIKEAIEAGSRV